MDANVLDTYTEHVGLPWLLNIPRIHNCSIRVVPTSVFRDYLYVILVLVVK